MASRRLQILASVAALTMAVVIPNAASLRTTGIRSKTPDVNQLVQAAQDEPSQVAAPSDASSEAPTAPSSTEPTEAPRTSPGHDAHDTALSELPRPEGSVRIVDALTDEQVPVFEAPAADDGPCPTASTCKEYSLRPPRWPSDDTGRVTIPFKFNDEGRRNLRAPAGMLESAFRGAAFEWHKWNSNIVFSEEGLTTATFGAEGTDGTCDDGTNTVTWHRFDPSIIAAVLVCTDDSGKKILDADLALNVTQHWEDVNGEADSRHTFDVRSIVTHELGHWLSLLDMYGAPQREQTMYGQADYGATNKRTLALGDITGVQKAYPCADGDTCPRKGVKDD